MWLLRPPKSRVRLNVVTYLVGILALVLVALVQVAGQLTYPSELLKTVPYPYPPVTFPATDSGGGGAFSIPNAPLPPPAADDLPDLVEEYLHGWPTPWLRRAVGYSDYRSASTSPSKWPVVSNACGATSIDPPWRINGHRISWSAPQAWPLAGNAWRFDVVGLLLNLLVASLVVTLPMAAIEFWLRRRGGLWRFRMIDLIVGFTLVAAGFGFWRWDQAMLQREREICRKAYGTSKSDDLLMRVHFSYVGPDWLARLAGNPCVIPVLQRGCHLWASDLTDPRLNLEALHSLEHLTSATFEVYFLRSPSKALATLQELPHLQSLYIDTPRMGLSHFTEDPPRMPRQLRFCLEDFPNLRELKFDTSWMTTSELERLQQRYPRIGIVCIYDGGRPAFRDEQIIVLRQGLERGWRCELAGDASELRLSQVPINGEHLQPIEKALPHIRKLQLHDLAIQPSGAPYLLKMTSLEELHLDIEEIPEDFVAALCQLPRLSKVALARPRVGFGVVSTQRASGTRTPP